METTPFKINGSFNSPENKDYDILGFHKKRVIVKGELVKVYYYKNFDGVNTYDDLVIEESRTFARDDFGLIVHRDLNVKWYTEDGDVGCEKNTVKYYSPAEAIDEGITRRSNIIADAKIYVLGQIGQALGFDLLTSVKAYIELYKDGYKIALINAISASTKPYLTQDMKDGINSILTF